MLEDHNFDDDSDDLLDNPLAPLYPTKKDVEDRYNARNEEEED